MSITDELREWKGNINTRLTPETVLALRSELNCIADRIDREHRMALEKVAAEADALPMTDESMAESSWVRLPVDADGEVIHIGDRVENNERVVRIVLTDGSWEPYVYVERLPNVLHEYFCNEISHYHEPTVEDVLREFVERWHDTHHDDIPALFAEFAAKLRLAGDE